MPDRVGSLTSREADWTMSNYGPTKLDREQSARAVAIAAAINMALLMADGKPPTINDVETIAASFERFILHGSDEPKADEERKRREAARGRVA